jgi:hypothetical protein
MGNIGVTIPAFHQFAGGVWIKAGFEGVNGPHDILMVVGVEPIGARVRPVKAAQPVGQRLDYGERFNDRHRSKLSANPSLISRQCSASIFLPRHWIKHTSV